MIDTDKWTMRLMYGIWVELSLIFILFGMWYMPFDQEAGDGIGASWLSMLTGAVGFMLLVIALDAGGYLMENNKRSE